jgi:putative colanic acid biosynthesis UDP-glucose lipid carrier transferase
MACTPQFRSGIGTNVRPGITGWAQVNDLRGETSSVDEMHLRAQYGLYYLKNWSLLLDVQIIASTSFIIVHVRNVI